MRILLISNLFPPDIGGPATHISRLASELYARGHRVRVIVCADNPRISSSEPYSVHRISRRLPVPFRFTIVFFWTWFYYFYSTLGFVVALIQHWWTRLFSGFKHSEKSNKNGAQISLD